MLTLKYIINFWIGSGIAAYIIGTVGDFIFYRKNKYTKIWDIWAILLSIVLGPFTFIMVFKSIYRGIKFKIEEKRNVK